MAHHKAPQKSIRRDAKVTERNVADKTKIKSVIKNLVKAVEKKDKKAAAEAFKSAESEIMGAVSKGILKKNNGARKVSRLSSKLKAIGATR